MGVSKWLMFAGFVLIVGYLCCHWIAGTQFGSTENTLIDSLQVFRTIEIYDRWSVPVINTSFFTTGISAIVHWDFSFLEGSYILWILYLFNIGLVFGVFSVFVGVITSAFGR